MLSSVLAQLALARYPNTNFLAYTSPGDLQSISEQDENSEMYTLSEDGYTISPKLVDKPLPDVPGIVDLGENPPDNPGEAEGHLASENSKVHRRRPASSFPMFLHKLAESEATDAGSSLITEEQDIDVIKPRKRQSPSFSLVSFRPDESIAKKMQEAGRSRRLQSQQMNSGSNSGTLSPTLSDPPEEVVAAPPESNDLHEECELYVQALECELQASMEEVERLKAERERDKVQILNKSVETAAKLERENKQKISMLKMELDEVTSRLNALTKEKEGWQEQLDTMHHRVMQAERHVRCIDHLTRLKLEAREEGAFGSVKRTKLLNPSTKASAEVIEAVVALNQDISQYAILLAENVQACAFVDKADDVTRSKKVIGETLTTSLRIHASFYSARTFLIQIVLEVFMVHWCSDIIEGWYPKQESFADVLLDFSAQDTNSSTIFPGLARVDHGKIKILKTDTTANYSRQVLEIITDLSRILELGSAHIRPARSNLFISKFLTIVKQAYDVRSALAEKDICGGLELALVGDGTPFQLTWMEEAHPISRTSTLTTMKMEPVAGTCGLGLRRHTASKIPTTSTLNPDMVLRPKVILSRALEEGSPW